MDPIAVARSMTGARTAVETGYLICMVYVQSKTVPRYVRGTMLSLPIRGPAVRRTPRMEQFGQITTVPRGRRSRPRSALEDLPQFDQLTHAHPGEMSLGQDEDESRAGPSRQDASMARAGWSDSSQSIRKGTVPSGCIGRIGELPFKHHAVRPSSRSMHQRSGGGCGSASRPRYSSIRDTRTAQLASLPAPDRRPPVCPPRSDRSRGRPRGSTSDRVRAVHCAFPWMSTPPPVRSRAVRPRVRHFLKISTGIDQMIDGGRIGLRGGAGVEFIQRGWHSDQFLDPIGRS